MPFFLAWVSMYFCHSRCPAESVVNATFLSSPRLLVLDVLGLLARLLLPRIVLLLRDLKPTSKTPAMSAPNSPSRHSASSTVILLPRGASLRMC